MSVKASVYMIASTGIHEQELCALMDHIGVSGWTTDSNDDCSRLIEVAGRLCYKSFAVGLNPNVTRVREGNHAYIENILKQKHGSVLEHGTVTFALMDVSRILTHELVRHRAGVAVSQESQRFVRLDNFDVYIPSLDDPLRKLAPIVSPGGSSEDDIIWANGAAMRLLGAVEYVKEVARSELKRIIDELGLDSDGVPFDVKKELTSALRRFLPGGVTTSIIVTANHRAWRHMIEMRTAQGAEIEIREVFYLIAKQLHSSFNAIYQDMYIGGRYGQDKMLCEFENSKV